MPQLDTTPWFITILSMIITLFILFQSNMSKYLYPLEPQPKTLKTQLYNAPWETKWTKIYLPHSLHLH
ncbi:ATP synthase F0 subunit 8 (mitochondrion) [Orycteropus afer]|uniref:ATP synthase F(0) complex subunit 8 n=1 Tax=Orycteropus afer TaxID=9818 RepID=ATP8_ORYAF|nr:ATP synthase F0 subunit 8 [Orycteropus afer]Q9XMI9.1 RecName: Full=ATP synthase protein 8; AltName: Full=A6L; AltName: Full=F-ATPase subunit 8 [Orycteropus afer]CAB41625.1 ATPase subunit 8 [Orycteropus afer]